MLKKSTEIQLLAFLTAVVVAFLSYLNVVSPGVEGGMDSYNHYLIAKNSWQNPTLLLDYWGKPIYNILASPFAQFGLNGLFILNVLCLVGCAVLSYKIAKILNLKHNYLAYILTLLSPIFLDNTISGLTEPLCAILVLLCIFLLVQENYSAGALIAGFLPFARSEGFVVLGVVIVFILWKAPKIKNLISLAVGPLIFNIIGWIITRQPFWIITENPYINFELSGNNICGSGGLFHYVWAGHYTFGLLTNVLLVIAGVILLLKVVKNGFKQNANLALIFAVFAAYFAAHSFIWWQGMMGSCGYIRVMVVIAPLGAITANFAISELYTKVWFKKLDKNLKWVIPGLIIANSVYIPFRYYSYKYPLQISEEQEQYELLNNWYQKQGFEERTKLYLYPYFSIIANINPYNQAEHLELWKSSLQWTKKGDILIWDGHFGPNESGLPLDTLKSKKEWKEIHAVIPAKPIATLNNEAFEIHVFEKVE